MMDRRRAGRRWLAVLALPASLLIAAVIGVPHALTGTLAPPPAGSGDTLDRRGDPRGVIEAAQAHLKQLPGDWSVWAQLGSAYLQQARITADPTYYPKADDALERSLTLRPSDNWPAMVGKAALANARHDFVAGLSWGRRAEQINPYRGEVHGVIADALAQLGDYPAAHEAVQKMLDVQPGVAAFTRASYDLELHGRIAEARDALEWALGQSSDLSDIAFCHYYLGELAFNAGDPQEAANRYQAALAADPRIQMALAGLAKAHAALGRTDEALREYDQAVQALPLPDLLVEYGDTLASVGQTTQARAQFDLVATEQELFAANGVTDHLLSATYYADHGQPERALTEAQAEWTVRHSVRAADALAWALHRNGRDDEALTYENTALRLGSRNATFYYHRGSIQAALGNSGPARSDLTEALTINPHFDIQQAGVARHILSTLDDRA